MKQNHISTSLLVKPLVISMIVLATLFVVQTSYACDMFAAISRIRESNMSLNSTQSFQYSQHMMTKLKATGGTNTSGCGFGIYYEYPQDVEIYRDNTGISTSTMYTHVYSNILHPQALPIQTHTLMAHARLWTSGPMGGVHPFRWNSRLGDNKVYTFMHNGGITVSTIKALLNNAGFSDTWIQNAYKACHNVSVAPAPLTMVDSELLFYLIMGMTERYRDLYTGLNQALYLIRQISNYTSINFILTDGTSIYSFKRATAGNNNKLFYSIRNINNVLRPMLIITSIPGSLPSGTSGFHPIELQDNQLLIYHQGENDPIIINGFGIIRGELRNLYAGIDWISFPVMEHNVVNASDYFEDLSGLSFGYIRTIESGYDQHELSDLNIRRDAGYILTMQNSVDDFLMKGTLTPKDYPVQLTPGENWIGYFLKDSYSPLVALSQVLDQITRIEARKWYMYRGKYGEWIGIVQKGAQVAMNYGEMYKVHYYGPSTSFAYSSFGAPLARYSPDEATNYTYTESPSYLGAAVYDAGWDTMPDEIAILKSGVVVGASIVTEYPVLIRAYTDGLDDIEIEASYIAKSGHSERRVIKSNDLSVKSLLSGVYEINVKNPQANPEEPSSDMIKDIKVYPNPLRTWSRISIETNSKGNVQVSIYNLKGQLVKSNLHEMKSAGTHSMIWDGKDSSGNELASGVYIIKARSGSETKTHKVIMLIR